MDKNSSEPSSTVIQKKICLLGEFAVGKTSLVRRFIEGRFDDRYLSTIGVKISRRQLVRPYGKLNLLLWDLAGSEELNDRITANYLRGAAGAVIVCDLTRSETLAGFRHHINQLKDIGLSIPLVFVGNKLDLIESRAINDGELAAVAQEFGAPYFVSSAKTGENVESIFDHLALQIETRE